MAVIAGQFLSRERVRFVDDLIAYMTLEEKLGQLNLAHSPQDPGLEAAIVAGRVGGVADGNTSQRLQTLATERSRLGIPLLVSTSDVPLPLSPWALAASWDEDLAQHLGAATASAVLGRGANQYLGPKVAIGSHRAIADKVKIAASQSHLAARLATAFADGAGVGDAAIVDRVLAAPVIEGRADHSLRCGLELAYRQHVLAIDCDALNRDAALKAGFSGMLIAECRRLTELLAAHFLGTSARAPVEAAEKAIFEGLVGEHEIDGAVRGVLAVKHALGLFRPTERSTTERQGGNTEVPSRAGILRRSMVLLRNESGLLPLSPVSDRVLVVGPSEGAAAACADALSRAGIGHSSAPGLALRRNGESWSTPVAGDHFAISLTRDAAQRVDFALVVLDDRHFVRTDAVPWMQPTPAVLSLLRALSLVGTRMAALVATNEPIDLGAADQHFSAVLQCWGNGPGFAEALADILSGRYSPQGRMPVSAGRFAFGQGLGYGENVFSSLSVAAGTDHVIASLRIRNTGSFTARETVQAYVRQPNDSLRLIDFAHVTLAPGEDVPVNFELGLEALGEIGSSHRLELAPGPCEILVGKDMARLLTARLDIGPGLARAIRRQDSVDLRVAAG